MAADWWQNFANNFAADLAPLLSLFGESPTKQYLSETLTFVDIFIFSMAPIGVLTAIVSAIRVAGDPSLRAFVGRAQEGAGIAEAELCSSTSRNVCELYNNGGIARVFGRPKILEFVHDWKPDATFDQHKLAARNEAGVYSFMEYLHFENWEDRKTRTSPKGRLDVENGIKPTYSGKDFAPHPNLSLNVGIKKLHRAWFYLAAILGFTLQASVLAFAALITYKYPNVFKKDDTQIAVPAFPLLFAGTVLLTIGVGTCASIIESSTYEQTFERKENRSSRLYWIQPGDQIVGDQVFDCFAYSDAHDQINEYTTSKRKIDRGNGTKQFLPKQAICVWAATIMTTVGFVLQFLGLRTLHSTVSVAQLGAIMVMSTVRALLRTRRLKEEHNILKDSSIVYLHHELDWLAMEMAQEDRSYSARGLLDQTSNPFWSFTGADDLIPTLEPSQQSVSEDPENKASKAYLKRVRLAQMTGAQTLDSNLGTHDAWDDAMIASRTWASKLACAIEGVLGVISRLCVMETPSRLHQSGISWSLRCWMDTASGKTPPKCTISLTTVHDPERTGVYGSWKADRAQLEGVLGLWLWSLISKERIRGVDGKDPPETNKTYSRNSRLLSVLGTSDDSDFQANLELWLADHNTSVRETNLNLKDSTAYPGSPWIEVDTPHGKAYEQVSEEIFYKEKNPTARRFFGSNVISAAINGNAKRESVRVLYTASPNSVEMMCAQELFIIFFSRVVREIEELGASTEIVKSSHRLSVAHSTISEIIKSFTSSGIGSQHDAILCTIPVLHYAKKLSYSSAFTAAREIAGGYSQRKDWRGAENVLLPALEFALQDFKDVQTIPLPGNTERTTEIFLCLLSLCELYRSALLSYKDHHLFGLEGVISLYKLWVDYGELPKALLSYKKNAFNLLKDEACSEDILLALDELRKLPGESENFNGNFDEALIQGDLAGTLHFIHPDVRASIESTGRPIFAFATKNKWYFILKDLLKLGFNPREVDHNGLNYLHYAAKSCVSSMFEDVVGDRDDLLGQVDNFGRTPLHLAAAAGNTGIVMLLAQKFSVEVNIRDQYHRSPLDHAILADRLSTFGFLSQLGNKDRTATPPEDIWDLQTKRLFQAACCGSVSIVVELLRTIISCDANERLRSARDSLLKCKVDLESGESCSEGLIKVLETLIDRVLPADTWNIEGRTGISFAAEADQPRLVAYLLNKCSKDLVIIKDHHGKNCLHHAVISRSQSAVEALVEWRHASHFFIKDKTGLDPLEYALKDRSLAIGAILLRTDPRGKKSILPGTAIAPTKASNIDKRVEYGLFFQSTDARIRKATIYINSRELHVDDPLPISARLFTPLAVIGSSTMHHLIYISNENILCDLYNENGCWGMGSLQGKGIKCGVRSRIAACNYYSQALVFYQDRENYIHGIDLNMLSKPTDYSQVIGAAAEGSDITLVGSEDNPFVYFQNGYSEIEEVSISLNFRGSLMRGMIREFNLDLRSPLAALCSNRDAQLNFILGCDKESRIRAFGPHKPTFWPQILEVMSGSPTELAVNMNKVFYQSKLGDIRAWEAGAQGFSNDILVVPSRALQATGIGEAESLHHMDPSQSLVSLT